MYRAPPKRTPRVAAVVSLERKNALVVIDPWEIRVAMVAPIATLRLALLRERPTAVAANRLWPWLARLPAEIMPAAPTDLRAPADVLPELRRFVGTKHEKLVASALVLADRTLTQALHAHFVPENRSRQDAHAAASAEAALAPRSLPLPHGG